jgi:hypothetical protein
MFDNLKTSRLRLGGHHEEGGESTGSATAFGVAIEIERRDIWLAETIVLGA